MHRGYRPLSLIFGILCVLHAAYAGRGVAGWMREATRVLQDIDIEQDGGLSDYDVPPPGKPRFSPNVWRAVLSGRVWPIMTFNSAEEVLEEFGNPTQDYTILLPPHSELYRLDVAVMSGKLDRYQVTNSMLMHIIPGAYTTEDFVSMPKYPDGMTLDTMSGEPLRFHWDKSGLERISISMNDRLLAILETPGNSSCKEGSVVHRISRVMLDSDVNAVMAEQETIVETQEPQNSNSKNNGQDARKLLTIGLPCLIAAVTAICVAVFVWIKLSDSNMGSEESEASGAHGAADPDPSNSKHSKHSKNAPKINGKGASVGKCAGRFMQKLYRLDTQRWSTVKPAEVAKPEQPEKKKKKKASAATSRTESGNRRASFSVQKSYPSNGVDTNGLKSDHACVICFEKEGDHVLLPCGHGGYCGSCAHTLLYQPNRARLCPICRARLGSIAKVDLGTAIGASANVLEASVGLVEPSSESVELRQWQALMRSTRRAPSQTFPPENVVRAARARAAAAEAGEARAEALAVMGTLVAQGALPPAAIDDDRAITQ